MFKSCHDYRHWDFIHVSKIWCPDKNRRGVLCINNVDSQGRRGWEELLFAVKITTTVLEEKSHNINTHSNQAQAEGIVSSTILAFMYEVFWYVSAHKMDELFKIFATDLVRGQTGPHFGYYPDDDGDKVCLGFLIVEYFSGFYANDSAVSVDGK